MTRATRNQELLQRRWRLAHFLASARRGRTVAGLAEHLEVSRATVYRDLEFLQAAGATLEVDKVNGEARYRVLDGPARVVGSPMCAVALDLALATLAPLKGTKLYGELGALRKELRATSGGPKVVLREAQQGPSESSLLGTLERAIEQGRELVIVYRGARDAEAVERRVWPLELELAKGQLYVLAHDPGRREARTFKVARIERATLGPAFDRAALAPVPRAASVVVWRAAPVAVVVRLAPEVARFAQEYPLRADQRLEPMPDGSVKVHAEVAGPEETMRWVLSWGRHAEVLAPVSLRAKLRGELGAALAAYEPPPKPDGKAAAARSGEEVVSAIVRRPAGRVGGAITAGARGR